MSKYLLSEEEYTEYQNMKARLNELKEDNEELNKRNNFLLRRLEVDDNDTSLVFKLQRELENSKSEFYCAIKSELKYKKALEEIKKYLGISSKTILERLEELQERRDELSEKNLSYEQALDEIKKKCCAVLNGDEKILYAYQIKKIINKIKKGNTNDK